MDPFSIQVECFKALFYDDLQHWVKIKAPRTLSSYGALLFVFNCQKELCNGCACKKFPV
jgi:hypothetical protein